MQSVLPQTVRDYRKVTIDSVLAGAGEEVSRLYRDAKVLKKLKLIKQVQLTTKLNNDILERRTATIIEEVKTVGGKYTSYIRGLSVIGNIAAVASIGVTAQQQYQDVYEATGSEGYAT